MEDIKFLALVLVGLFAIFLISGSITGAVTLPWSKVATVQKTATVPISTVKSVDVAGTGCVKLTSDQCNSICGTGVVYSTTTTPKCVPPNCVGCSTEVEEKACYTELKGIISGKTTFGECISKGFSPAFCAVFLPKA